MSEYFKWVESRYGGKMYFMGSNFGYCPVGGLKEKQNWRTGFSSPSNFGIFKDTEETSPPYSGWEKDCLTFSLKIFLQIKRMLMKCIYIY